MFCRVIASSSNIILFVSAFYMAITFGKVEALAQEEGSKWGVESISVEMVPTEWRHLVPQCREHLGNFLRGIPSGTAREQGLTEQSVQLMLDIAQDPEIPVDQVFQTYWDKLNQLHPNVMQNIKKAIDADALQAYIGNTTNFVLKVKHSDANLGVSVQCKFSKLSGDAFLEHVGIGRTQIINNEKKRTAILSMKVNHNFDYVKEGDENLLDCVPGRLMTFRAVGCPVGAVMREHYLQPDLILTFSTGILMLADNKLDEALKHLDDFLKEAPDSFEGHFHRGRAYAGLGELGLAIADLDDALRINPKAFEAHFFKAKVHAAAGNLAQAIKDITTSISLQQPTETELYLFRGRLLLMSGNASAAYEDLKKAVELNPNSAEGRFLYGTSLLMNGDIRAAILELDLSIKQNPNNPDAFRNRGTAYARLKKFDEALADYSQAIKLNSVFVDAHFDRIRVHKLRHDQKKVIAGFKDLLKSAPDNVKALNDLAWELATHKDHTFRDGDKAVELALKALSLSDNDAYYRDTLAATYAEAGRFDDAIREQRLSVEGIKAQGKDTTEFQTHLKAYLEHKPWRE